MPHNSLVLLTSVRQLISLKEDNKSKIKHVP